MTKKHKNPESIDPQLIQDEINKRAYEISLQRGEGGNALNDWLLAEKEILQKYNIQKPQKEIKVMENKKKYIDKLSTQLKEWDDEIKTLKTKAESLKADSKKKYQVMLDEYQDKKDAAQKKLKELKNSSEESWEELKKGTEIIWNELKKTSGNVISKFK